MNKRGRSGFWVLLVVGLGLFMALLDATIVNISLPAMMRDFGVGTSTISWVLNAYNLAFAAVLVAGGNLADRFGRRRAYLAGIAGFVAFSAACALAPSAGWLIAFRAAQGLSAAVLVPATLALVVAAVPRERLGGALGAWGAVGAFAAALGPSLGGALTEWASWHWIFWVNLPVGAFAAVLALAIVAESSDPAAAGRRPDVLGVITLTGGLFALTLALIEGQSWGWTSGRILGLFAGSAVCLVLWVLVERGAPDPMVDLSVFRNRTFASGSAVLLLTSVGLGGAMFLLPQFLVGVAGHTELEAGLAITPMSLAVMVVGVLAGRISDRIGPRLPVGVGVLLMAAGLLLLRGLDSRAGAAEVLPGLVMLGVGLGLSLVPANTAAVAALPDEGYGVASGILATFRQIGIVFGVAILVAVLSAQLTHQGAAARQEMRDAVHRADLPDAAVAAALRRVSDFSLSEGLASTGSTAPDVDRKELAEATQKQVREQVKTQTDRVVAQEFQKQVESRTDAAVEQQVEETTKQQTDALVASQLTAAGLTPETAPPGVEENIRSQVRPRVEEQVRAKEDEIRAKARPEVERALEEAGAEEKIRAEAEPKVRAAVEEEARAEEARVDSELSALADRDRDIAERRASDSFDATYPVGAAIVALALVPALLLGPAGPQRIEPSASRIDGYRSAGERALAARTGRGKARRRA